MSDQTHTLIENILTETLVAGHDQYNNPMIVPSTVKEAALKIAARSEIGFNPTPDNPCGHQLRIHDVCPRCGMLGAAEYLDKQQQREIPLLSVDDVIDRLQRHSKYLHNPLIRDILALLQFQKQEGQPAGDLSIKAIHRVVRKDTEEYRQYLEARFRAPVSDVFAWEGHRWKYLMTSFDDIGEFDIIFRNETRMEREAGGQWGKPVEVPGPQSLPLPESTKAFGKPSQGCLDEIAKINQNITK